MCFDFSFNYMMSFCLEQLGLLAPGNLFYEFNDSMITFIGGLR